VSANWPPICGRNEPDQALAAAQQETRRYAKRQSTWRAQSDGRLAETLDPTQMEAVSCAEPRLTSNGHGKSWTFFWRMLVREILVLRRATVSGLTIIVSPVSGRSPRPPQGLFYCPKLQVPHMTAHQTIEADDIQQATDP
jgi:hypothetical protein